ncbi:MAG: alkaline phosphatase family protein [Chloroflexota bacterium]
MSIKKRLSALLLVALIQIVLFVSLSTATQFVSAQSVTSIPDYTFYYLNYLALPSNIAKLNNSMIMTRGFVKFLASVYMYEDFWLQDQINQSVRIPVVVRFSNLTIPNKDALIEVQGTITYSKLEGGFYYLNASSWKELKNVILIGWDGVQRNHLFELLNAGRLLNLQSFINNGTIANVTVSDHRTDTKSGWTQILTGYRWWKTGVYNNGYWFHSIPLGYTIGERVEQYFGKDKVVTAHIAGKLDHMEVKNETGSAATGLYSHEAIFSNLPSQIDVCNTGARNASVVGPLTLQFLANNSKSHFFAFFHFSDPDSAGHNPTIGGENSLLYEDAIMRCDFWLGQILNKLDDLNITQNTLVYVTADHGFDEGGTQHNNAPFVYLASNDKRVNRDGDQVDVAPTVYYGLGIWENNFVPSLDGYPLQISLPIGETERRQSILLDNTQPTKATISTPSNGADISGPITIKFNASDKYLSTVLLLINNNLKADGPWTWQQGDMIRVNGSYYWNTTLFASGQYNITVLSFDEHGATNSPSTSRITINLISTNIPEIPTAFAAILILILLSSTIVYIKRKLIII